MSRLKLILAILGALVFASLASPATAQGAGRRVALIIANAHYQHANALKNPIADAGLMDAALRKAGFTVVDTQGDLSNGGMRDALRRFSAEAAGAEVALVYYAGHGIEAANANWLIPVDATLQAATDLDYDAVNTDLVLKATAGAKVRIVVLDACRDSPFGRGWESSSRDVNQGLAEVKANGVLVLFSAAPGQVALDGTGANSPFAEALARRLPQPGLELHILGSVVRDDVIKATDDRQQPYVSESISGDAFVFVGGGATVNIVSATPQPQTPAFDPRSMELAMWNSVSTSGDAAQLQVYLKRYPTGEFADLARAKLAALARTSAPVVTPPAATASKDAYPFDKLAEETRQSQIATFQKSGAVPAMVTIPAGSFVMGSPASEPGRYDNEGPQHTVNVRSFQVSKNLITVGQFRAFVADTRYDAGDACSTPDETGKIVLQQGRSWRAPSFIQGDDEPVVCVSWADANAYAGWLSRKTGHRYRLLSEAEYEYVIRAGSTSTYWWGDDVGRACDYADTADLDAKVHYPTWTTVACHDGYIHTAPVGHFRANAFGLYDPVGNALSWTQDCLVRSYNGAPTDGSARLSGDCDTRILRGAAWDGYAPDLRAANRGWHTASDRNYDIGFRVARSF